LKDARVADPADSHAGSVSKPERAQYGTGLQIEHTLQNNDRPWFEIE
jgi:hypothetical protein